jgi:D-tyrosyl-tRNA(Tyr) deacylase
MKVVIQRVAQASVTIDNKVKSRIGNGLLLLAGFEETDSIDDLNWCSGKICNMRIFNDADGKMNISVKDIKGEVLLISQFTLHALTAKGNRPSFIKAAKPGVAIPLYENFILTLEKELGKPVSTGEFGADMKVELINDGPVTILIDSKKKE